MEQFLYRLSQSHLADRFILKGALMLRVWQSSVYRPTMDIDMLGRSILSEKKILAQFKDVISVPVEPDGLTFNPDTLHTESITEQNLYQGIRVRFIGYLTTAKINMQIDIGFGDIVYPMPEKNELPTILNLPAPKLLCYSRESAIAEKFEAVIKLGSLNSRMKDFYDIWLLSRQFCFESFKLMEAIRLTFRQRQTELNLPVDAFTPNFIHAKQEQWIAFYKRIRNDHIPLSFKEIVKDIEDFLNPIILSIIQNMPFTSTWQPSEGWLKNEIDRSHINDLLFRETTGASPVLTNPPFNPRQIIKSYILVWFSQV